MFSLRGLDELLSIASLHHLYLYHTNQKVQFDWLVYVYKFHMIVDDLMYETKKTSKSPITKTL